MGPPARWSSIPSVKAYRGSLPDRERGIEFTTDVVPTSGAGSPVVARWYQGTPGVSVNRLGLAVIRVKVTKNTQVP